MCEERNSKSLNVTEEIFNKTCENLVLNGYDPSIKRLILKTFKTKNSEGIQEELTKIGKKIK